jgi:hypothetical protein
MDFLELAFAKVYIVFIGKGNLLIDSFHETAPQPTP